MYQVHSQMGRTSVNKIRESIKTRKTHTQYKMDKSTGLDKLFNLQKDLFKEGLDADEYNDYILGNISNKNFYYKGLTNEDIEKLKDRYGNLIEKENNKYIMKGQNNELNRKRRSDFKNKKRIIINEKKTFLIETLLKEMRKANTNGVLRNTENISVDPENWNNTKNNLFSGGRYIESHDKGWVEVYRKVVSNFSPHLFDLHSITDLNQFVFDA